MKATEAMAKAALSAGYTGRLKWMEMTTAEQASWLAIAQAVLDLAPASAQPEYVDCRVTSSEMTVHPGGGTEITLKVMVPPVARYGREPGSTRPLVHKILSQLTHSDVALRLSAVSTEQARSEFNRMEPDGTIREFSPGEATW